MPISDELSATIEVSHDVERTPRVMQIEGIFDIPPTQRSALSWDVRLPLNEKPWNIGLIVGPSGCGKSTIARKLFPDVDRTFAWPKDHAILDGFPAAMGAKEIVALLSSVGFSSPPSWLRPFRVLSNGEQFRVGLARLLAESPDLAVVDEFSSVVDRTVAQIGSSALAKTVRRRGQRFIAVTCHEDVEAWLQPDWVYRPAENAFQWRELQRRPAIELEIVRAHHSAWSLFGHHHYLTAKLNHSAVCFVATMKSDSRPVAFVAWINHVGTPRNMVRVHRVVCLPDWQAAGIGNAIMGFTASAWKALGKRVALTTSHPALIRRANSFWRLTRSAKLSPIDALKSLSRTRAVDRLTSSFEFFGPAMDRERAERLFQAKT